MPVTLKSTGMRWTKLRSMLLLLRKWRRFCAPDLRMPALSNGKDSILRAITDNATDDATKILAATEADTLQGAEGFS